MPYPRISAGASLHDTPRNVELALLLKRFACKEPGTTGGRTQLQPRDYILRSKEASRSRDVWLVPWKFQLPRAGTLRKTYRGNDVPR